MKILRPSQVWTLQTYFSNVKVYKHKRSHWYNIPCCFDIETSSWIEDNEGITNKRACMYVWQFAVGTDFVFVGRTWDEFIKFVDDLKKMLHLHRAKRLIVYIHNLAYEFQWIRQYFNILEMLAISERKPIKVLTDIGIEFRCSYILTNSSLDTLCKNYNLKNAKTHGLDYNKIRNSKTPLSDDELEYIVNDVLAVNEYIYIEMTQHNDKIDMIENTSTGKVRVECREQTINLSKNGGNDNGAAIRYHGMIQGLTLEPDEFLLMHKAYQGGLTHCNSHHMGKELHFMESKDFTSSYPWQMMKPCFPMSRGKHIGPIDDINEFNNYLKYYCCIMSITLYDVQPKLKQESILASSKCWDNVDYQTNNGRVYSAGKLTTACTELDLEMYSKFYTWSKFTVNDLYVYAKGYLPKQLVMEVLKLYNDKTTLKGVSGEEINYLSAKQKVNSVYGMCVTNIIRDKVDYTTEWFTTPCDLKQEIEKYNKDKTRFLYYAWGVYISALARYELCKAIIAMGDDYVYCDTDSIKYLNPELHNDWFKDYNNKVLKQIINISNEREIPLVLFIPKTIEGVSKPLGVFDFDGKYVKFKTLGAKRYMYLDEKGYHLTVAGLSKNNGMQYIIDHYKKPFEAFSNDLYIPGDATGKMTHTYIDYETSGTVTDYLGNTAEYNEKSSVHLMPCEYDFSISQEYMNFILSIREKEVG